MFSSLAIASECLSVAFSLKCQNKCCPVDWFGQIAPKAVEFAFRSPFTSQFCQHVITATRTIVRYYFPVFLFPYCVTFGESCPYKKKNYSNAHTHKNKNRQNQTFLTITEIHNPNFITSKIQTPDPKLNENRKPLQLQDPQIR